MRVFHFSIVKYSSSSSFQCFISALKVCFYCSFFLDWFLLLQQSYTRGCDIVFMKYSKIMTGSILTETIMFCSPRCPTPRDEKKVSRSSWAIASVGRSPSRPRLPILERQRRLTTPMALGRMVIMVTGSAIALETHTTVPQTGKSQR